MERVSKNAQTPVVSVRVPKERMCVACNGSGLSPDSKGKCSMCEGKGSLREAVKAKKKSKAQRA